LRLYQADFAYLLYDPMLRTGVCWGDPVVGGDCSGVNFENVTGEIVGNYLGFVALEGFEGTAECWGDVDCSSLSFVGVEKIIAGYANFLAVEPIHGFCFPLPCHENMTIGLLDQITPVGPGFFGYNTTGDLVCFAEISKKTHESIERLCADLISWNPVHHNGYGRNVAVCSLRICQRI
jgi:hypothetical protein